MLKKNPHPNKLKNGFLVTIGYILSPLSWWNDLVVNIPLAYVFATIFSFFCKGCFSLFMILGYWLSNLAGLLLMHHGTVNLLKANSSSSKKRFLVNNLVFSLIYTLIIAYLIVSGKLKPPQQYLHFSWYN